MSRIVATRRPLLVATVLLFAACSAQREPTAPQKPTALQKQSGAATPVALSFNWPDGLSARVRSTSVKSQSVGPRSRTQDLTAEYVMDARRNEAGVDVSFDHFEVHQAPEAKGDGAAERVLAYRPGFAVDNTGKLVEVQGLEVLKSLLEPLQSRMTTASTEEQQGLQALAQTVTNEHYLKARAGAEWNNMIGAWLHASLTPGKVRTTEEESAASGILDVPIHTRIQTSLTRIDGCERIGATDCVRLRMIKQPDEDKMREAMLPNIGKLLGVEDWGPEGPPKIHSIVATSQLIVDTEANTLIPHRIEALRVFILELVRPEGLIQVRDSNRMTSTYTYDSNGE